MACSSTVSSLNEMIDSSGKNTPSATPELSSSYDSGAGFTNAEAPSALATCLGDPAAGADLQPLHVADTRHRLLGEHLARAVGEHAQELHAA